MFSELQIAQSEFRVKNASYNRQHEAEGVTVQVPNVFDRIAADARAALVHHTQKAAKSLATLTHSSVPAQS